jgi:cytochrome c-type biogenesis protein CcmF
VRQPQRTILVAIVSVTRDGRRIGELHPSLNQYPNASDLIGTPSIEYGVLKDLYSSVIGFEGTGGRVATFRFFLNPGVMWLWVGGGIMALGGLLAAWPERRRRQLAEPPETAPAVPAKVGVGG